MKNFKVNAIKNVLLFYSLVISGDRIAFFHFFSHFKKFFNFIFDVFLESKNKIAKKNFLVDLDPTKVESLRGFEGPKVIFLNFLVP